MSSYTQYCKYVILFRIVLICQPHCIWKCKQFVQLYLQMKMYTISFDYNFRWKCMPFLWLSQTKMNTTSFVIITQETAYNFFGNNCGWKCVQCIILLTLCRHEINEVRQFLQHTDIFSLYVLQDTEHFIIYKQMHIFCKNQKI